MISIKRAYEKPEAKDGLRILVDRFWPRGVKKKNLEIHEWAKDIAPSADLLSWFGHNPDRWPEFKKRYKDELKEKRDLIKNVEEVAKNRTVTLVCGAKDENYNNAIILLETLKGD